MNLSDFETGKMFARDGTTIIDDPNVFAAEWQIRDDEPMLFNTPRSPQYPETCELPAVKSESRRLREAIFRVSAEKACAKWSEETRDACVHDVLASGDLDLADNIF